VVVALNEADGGEIETTTREDLCEYIDEALTDAGVDVEALTRRRGLDSSELTDEWRDW
jgi:molybdate-binding protein